MIGGASHYFSKSWGEGGFGVLNMRFGVSKFLYRKSGNFELFVYHRKNNCYYHDTDKEVEGKSEFVTLILYKTALFPHVTS